jgi:type I restriction enzyme S subunit
MGSEWRFSTWGDEISLEYGKSLKGYRESNGPVRVFGSNGAVGWTDRMLAEGPGVILGRKGAYRGVRYSPAPFYVIDTAYYAKPKTNLDMRWLYYAIIHHKLGEIDDGSPIPSTTRAAVYVVDLEVPPISEQKTIADILGSLDDKIELNRRMNATLEGMAQALFKSWFVDFDPVIDNALVAGNPIPDELAERAEVRRKALADGTANREAAKQFPAAFQFTEEMGWIPEGWEARSLGNILRSVSDTYPLKTVDKVVFLNTGDILDGRFLHHNLSDVTGLPGQAKKSILKNDILYSEIRPKNRRFAYVYFDSPCHVVSTKLMVLRATSDVSSMFAYLILKQDSTINFLQMMAESRSGTFPQITFDILSKIEVALPKEIELVSTFTETILKPTFQKQLKNDSIAEKITKLRDTLLPQLISGALRIPKAEKLAEEAMV